MRGLWVLLPVLSTGLPLSEVIGVDYEYPVVAGIGLWLIWAVGLGAALSPIPLTLVVIRIVMPAAVVISLAAVVVGETRPVELIVLLIATVAASLALSARIGDRFADGASYGDERRMLLRPPTGVLLGPLPLAWIAVVLGACAGPFLLGDARWIAGVIATVVGLPMAYLGFRSLHSLAKRWIVFVPTGMVIHDLVTLLDPVLFPRDAVRFVGPALADSEAHDLSAGATGLLLELNLIAETKVPVRDKTGPGAIASEPADLGAVLFAPSLPGEALQEADQRKLPVH